MSRLPPRRSYVPDPHAPARGCDMPGCPNEAGFRAPRSRDNLSDYWWFCLDHVREYNAKWDFYKGMSGEQIEAQLRLDTGWQRPTWPLGKLGPHLDAAHIEDLIDRAAPAWRPATPQPAKTTPPELRQPLSTLGLEWPTTIETVKSRYKALAKQHHPDANGGSREAEERLKHINLAYAAVRARLVAEPKVA